jgi:hypothetical protein
MIPVQSFLLMKMRVYFGEMDLRAPCDYSKIVPIKKRPILLNIFLSKPSLCFGVGYSHLTYIRNGAYLAHGHF